MHLLTLTKLWVLTALFILISNLTATGQSANLSKVQGLPSSEAYDILMDKKGFIWVGHNLGLSRYDGHSFTTFTSPDLLSLSMTDLNEDSQGRIWCHNFSGQIVYIEHEKLHILKSYDPRLEQNYPRITLVRNHLFSTTDEGLFIYNIKSQKYKYIPCTSSAGKKHPTSSITRLGSNVIAYGVAFGIAEWFKCDTNGHVKTLAKHSSLHAIKDNSYLLQPITYQDTIYVISNIAGLVHKLRVEHDTVKVVGKIKMSSFINTLSQVKRSLWINTKKESINPESGQKIENYNISNIISGSMGNTWYSSLKFGLLVNAKAPKWQNEIVPLNEGDYVRCICKNSDYLLLGTQNGHLLLKHHLSPNILHNLSLPSTCGAIETIKRFDSNSFLVGASMGIFLYQPGEKKLTQLSPTLTFKDAVLIANKLYTAQTTNAFVSPASTLSELKASLPGTSLLPKRQRSRALVYDTASKTLYSAFKNDLIKLHDNRLTRVLFNNNSIYASTLVGRGHKVLIGTYTQGLLLLTPSGIKSYNSNNGLLSNTIFKIALFNNHAWVAGNNCLQLFDMDTEKFIERINYPTADDIAVYDILEDDNKLYVTTANGIQSIDYRAVTNTFNIKNYLLYSIVNNHDTVFGHKARLPYHKNNIGFTLSAVSYDNANEVYFKYKLFGSNDSKWQYLPPGVKTVQYASLMPGTYRFLAIAQHTQGKLTSPPIVFDLIIDDPWWMQWWFMALILLILVLLTIACFKFYHKILLDKQKLRYEKILAIEYERQTISRELHDNIGQLLSLTKLTLGTTAGKSDEYKQEKIEESRELVGQAITDLRNMSKSLTFQNMSHLGLTKTIQAEAERINRSNLVNMAVKVNGKPYSLGEQNELVLFRIFQEALNNSLKHAYAEHLVVTLQFDFDKVMLTIIDDGKGFVKSDKIQESGSGLRNMENRAVLIGADMSINTAPGKGTQIVVTLDTFTP
ncbi:hypothetical protein KHS38_05045 [Mucilaginibacter sp. Bleaf8]|uniref:sensor histidine kinase n=1 Tax=Mucilaginibacter sp. Bleaf8 TaxID=2834430 RepID=UPI001BCDBCB6|nr:sensor histidine kinase [Mucilaginibacter sp. Bleaf8]MBS7563762.1 hypothetical protein [Mucilaginibacter sp. Bleaf8]